MLGDRAPALSLRQATESRAAILVIVLVSSMAFLLFQARKDALDNMLRHEARLAIQAALGGEPSGAPVSGISAWPKQRTLIVPLKACTPSRCTRTLAGQEAIEDTKGRFVIRRGALFASVFGDGVAFVTTAPLSVLAEGLLGRISMDMAGVFFLGCLLLLVRESRLSDYSVHRLLDASPVPLILCDVQGHIEFANRQAFDLFDGVRSPDELSAALHRQHALFEWLTSPQGPSESIETGEFEFGRDGNSSHRLLVSRQSLVVRSKRMIIACAADITVRHHAEAALLQAKNAAETLERAKSESLAMISHELRTPVNGVLGLAQLLVRYELPDGAAQIVNRMIQAGRTLAAIINDIVDFALLEVRQMRIEQRSFDLRETITGASTLASAAAAAKGLVVRVSNLAPLPPKVLGDPARLQQIIINLVGNSIKFTESGHVEVRTDLIRQSDNAVEVAIEVVDTGIGIAADVIPRLFHPFSQGEAGHQRRFEGTGLGLAISKGLAEAMGGTIEVRSEIGSGSSFVVRLPFALPQQDEGLPTRAPPALRVLVVDDVALNREIVAELLQVEGSHVTSAASAQEALEILSAQRFDLVLMDIRMPVMDGLAATAAIRAFTGAQRHRGLILGLTANPLQTQLPLYLLRGIDGILEKPVDVDKLRTALCRAAPQEAPMPALETARIGQLRQRLGESRALRIVEAFAQTARDAIEGIATACARGGFEDVAEHAHRLAGGAENLQFRRLADSAAALESAARSRNAALVPEAALPAVSNYLEVERYVRELLLSMQSTSEKR